MADISSTIKEIAMAKRSFSPFTAIRGYTWDPVNDGTEATGTHNIVPINQNEALVFGYGAVDTTFTSSGSATVQFKIGSDALTGLIPKANLAAGDIFTFGALTGDGTTVAQTQDALTDNSGGSANTTIANIASADTSETTDRSVVADAVADLAAQLAKIKTDVANIISAIDPVTTYAGFAKSADDTLDIAVGTSAITAGKLYLVCCFVDFNIFSNDING